MKKTNFRPFLNAIFLLLIFGLTLWSVFGGENLSQLLSCLQTADPAYIIPGIICVLLFVMGESTVIYYLMNTQNIGITFSRCCLYSFIGFFYSCITPSASGGQPMQIIAMRRDRIPVAVSTVVLGIVTITYKLVLVLLGLVVIILRPAQIMLYLDPVMPFIYLGVILNVGCILLLLMLVFYPDTIKHVTGWLFSIANRIRPFKHPEKQNARLQHMIDQYRGTADFFRSNRHVIIHVFLITLGQRFILFFVTWLTYRAFSLSGQSASVIITLQGMISVAADMLPLPGGMGVSENLFLTIFSPIFGEELVLSGMVISRGISYYTQLLISAAMTFVSTFIIREKNNVAQNT